MYYEALQSAYGWTVQEIDRQDAAFLIEQLAAKIKSECGGKQYIEDVI